MERFSSRLVKPWRVIWINMTQIDRNGLFTRDRIDYARARIASNIAGVSFPVNVFCWLTW
jgi:hypothetical protein